MMSSSAESATASPARRRAPAPRTVLAVSSIGGFMAFVDATVVNVAFPDMQASFPDVRISELSWVLNGYNIVFAAFLVLAGRLADLLGRRRVYLAALALFTVASLACALAPTVGWLIGLRVLQAVGAAFLVPSSLALVLQAYPQDERARAVATVAAVGALAAGIGPALGGLLVEADSWRWVFLVNVPVGVAGYLLGRTRLLESRQAGRRRVPDVPGAIAFAVAIGALVLAIVQGEEWGWGSTWTVEAFAAAAVLGVIVVRRCSRHRSPIVDLTLFRDRGFSVANAASIVAAAGFFSYTLVNVLYLTEVWRYSVLEAGLAITPGPVVAIACARPAGRIADRVGQRPVLVGGGLLWGAAVLWFAERVGPAPAFLAEWLPGMVLLGIGAGLLFPTLSAVAVASAPGAGFGVATAVNTVARQVGAALGVAVVVAIIQAGAGDPAAALRAFDDAWRFAGAALAAAGLCCLGVGRIRRADPDTVVLPVARPWHPRRAETRRPLGTPVTHIVPVEPPGRQEPAEFLAAVPVFAALPPEVRETIAAGAQVVRLPAGEWLFRRGDPGDVLYVVQSGRLEVVGTGDAGVLRVLGRGAVLGELALLTAEPRSASVRAARTSTLLAVRRAEFERLLAADAAASLALTRTLATQLRNGTGLPRAAAGALPATIAVVALDGRAPATELAHHLAAELGRFGRVGLLDGRLPEAARTGAAAHGGTATAVLADTVAVHAPVLDAALARHDQVVLLAGGSGPGWTEFCLQQADRILAVGSGAAEPAPRRELRGCDLVGWNTPPGSGLLAGWAQALEPAATHVVRSASVGADVARLARRLTGRSVGVVLAGGGARAFAHIGVLDELLAAGVTIDRVGGVSMGAFVGALFALGHGPEEIDATCFDEWARRRPLRDYTVPRHSLIRGDRCRAMLRRCFGDVAIEELPRGFYSAASELRSGELVVFRSGPLFDAVGASMAIPVLAPALIRDRQILVDGGLVDNLPVAPMAALGEGPVIAVDIKATFERPAAAPGRVHPPSLGEVLARVLILGSADTSANARRHADWTIVPRDPGIGLFEFHQIDAAREAGRAAAREALGGAPPTIFG